MLVIGLGLMAGCGGDDDPADPSGGDGGGGGNQTAGTITFTLDGTAMDYSNSISATNIGEVDERIIGGTAVDGNHVIMITIPKETGTHIINSSNDYSINVTEGTSFWGCVSGSVILTTSTDTHLVGSFTGTFEDIQQNTVLVTNGAFDVPLVLVQ